MSDKIIIKIEGDANKYLDELDAVDKQVEKTAASVHLTVENAMIGMRILLDTAALVSVVSGEKIDTQFLMMISMMTSQMKSMAANIAVFAATPGMQPFAVMLATMIPMVTSTIMYIKSQQMQMTQALQKEKEADLDSFLNTVSYNG